MVSVNKVILVGNVGADPETRYMPNGDAVCNFRLATTESWKDKNSGEKRELTEWHRIVCYRKLAEITSQYVKKGSQLYLEGRIKTRKWQDKDGHDRYTDGRRHSVPAGRHECRSGFREGLCPRSSGCLTCCTNPLRDHIPHGVMVPARFV